MRRIASDGPVGARALQTKLALVCRLVLSRGLILAMDFRVRSPALWVQANSPSSVLSRERCIASLESLITGIERAMIVPPSKLPRSALPMEPFNG